MRKLGTLSIAAVLLGFAAPAAAQDVSGGVDLKSSYVLGDYLYQAGPDPVVQGYVDVAIGKTGCKASGWGNLSTGKQIGSEIDLGAGCTFNADKKTVVTITATRYLLLDKGVPDMTAVTTSVTRGPIDATVGVYLWDKLPDGFAANVGYTAKRGKWSARGSLHYAHGLGDDDIVFAGLKANYALTGNLSANLQGYVPVFKTDRDARKARVVAGLSFSF